MSDDLRRLVTRLEAERPGVREGREDIKHLHAVLDDLVAIRRSSGLTQMEVAARMGVTQSTVSQFESESSDPRIATLQRYARALGLRLVVTTEPVPARRKAPRIPPPAPPVRRSRWRRYGRDE